MGPLVLAFGFGATRFPRLGGVSRGFEADYGSGLREDRLRSDLCNDGPFMHSSVVGFALSS